MFQDGRKERVGSTKDTYFACMSMEFLIEMNSDLYGFLLNANGGMNYFFLLL